ncbi:MAG: GIY-YIG nuclease family protein [Candidatus Marinimicrobia bacterium]|nr:GIY-YIG nuclease family protein [Candidatus Neomarinimicrobiota bacterium]MCF7851108.1 GIY-YIG nuclease family protein [Candidatus Neomarinimicrobiota bacterium]MCF7904344.1 GIY-YIG nuclease family protein [Candidatus Neomarinimicrobiota bacterium]
MRSYYVYIMTNRSRTLYIGITNDIARRMQEHKERRVKGFTKKYSIDQLLHFEEFNDVYDAIFREKQLKGWLRSKKIELIEENNPNWNDLSFELLD